MRKQNKLMHVCLCVLLQPWYDSMSGKRICHHRRRLNLAEEISIEKKMARPKFGEG